MAEQEERLEGLVEEETCAKDSIDELEVCKTSFHVHAIERTYALSVPQVIGMVTDLSATINV